MHAISEHHRGVFTTRRYTNPSLPLPLPLQAYNCAVKNQNVCMQVLTLENTVLLDIELL